MKTCSKCKRILPLELFPRRKRSPDGKSSWCKSCFKEHWKDYYEEHREVLSKRRSKYNSSKDRNRHLKYNYGIDYHEYEEMLIRQNGLCAVCKTTGERSHLSIDHNHKTGKIRGLLCHTCNSALGMLKENKDIVANLLRYLNEHT